MLGRSSHSTSPKDRRFGPGSRLLLGSVLSGAAAYSALMSPFAASANGPLDPVTGAVGGGGTPLAGGVGAALAPGASTVGNVVDKVASPLPVATPAPVVAPVMVAVTAAVDLVVAPAHPAARDAISAASTSMASVVTVVAPIIDAGTTTVPIVPSVIRPIAPVVAPVLETVVAPVLETAVTPVAPALPTIPAPSPIIPELPGGVIPPVTIPADPIATWPLIPVVVHMPPRAPAPLSTTETTSTGASSAVVPEPGWSIDHIDATPLIAAPSAIFAPALSADATTDSRAAQADAPVVAGAEPIARAQLANARGADFAITAGHTAPSTVSSVASAEGIPAAVGVPGFKPASTGTAGISSVPYSPAMVLAASALIAAALLCLGPCALRRRRPASMAYLPFVPPA